MPYMNVEPLRKVASDAAAKVKECEKAVTARKTELAAVKKAATQKPTALKTAEDKQAAASKALKKAQDAMTAAKNSKTATQKEKDEKQKVFEAARAAEAAAITAKKDAEHKWKSDTSAKVTEALNAVRDAEKKLATAKTESTKAEQKVKDQMKLNLQIAAEETKKKVAETAKAAADAFKKDPAGTTANAAKAVVGGVQDLALSGVSALANSKLLKGTKAGTTADLIAGVGKLADAWKDVGIDSVAALATGIYQGKTVGQISDSVVATAKKSTKGNVDDVVDKAMAALKAYDVNFSKQDLSKYAKDLKTYAKAKMK